MGNIKIKYFSDINLKDNFFDSLRADYQGFDKWFHSKAKTGEVAYVFYINKKINAFLYLKVEEETTDIVPPLSQGKKLTENDLNMIYVTIFEKYSYLISLLETYGFHLYGTKTSKTGTENVYVKNFKNIGNNILLNYPIVRFDNVQKYVLSIYPKFHSRLFPDSILNNEDYSLIDDISPTNSIHKIYICGMKDVKKFRYGDLILIYRTKDDKGPAKYRSVLTSVCTVEEVKDMSDFYDINDYLKYCEPYSIFTREELVQFYERRRYPFIVKMIYNIAFKKRVIKAYLDNLGIEPSYWGVFQIDNQSFLDICKQGHINANLIHYR